MKVKEFDVILPRMEYLLEQIANSDDFKELKEKWENLTLNSEYFFSNTDPNDIFNNLNDMIHDIVMIREDISNKISDNSQNLEL